MDDQQPYKSSEKTSESIEEDKKRQLELRRRQLEELIGQMIENVKEQANLNEIEKYIVNVDLILDKLNNKRMLEGHEIKVSIYSKDDVIECYSYKGTPYLIDKIVCINYNLDKSFELPNSIYYIQGIKNTIRDIVNTTDPRVFTDMGKLGNSLYIKTVDSKYSNESIKDSPEMEISKSGIRYNDGRSKTETEWHLYDLFELHEQGRIYTSSETHELLMQNIGNYFSGYFSES
jgi:hypothetical protein